jgi:hypothetical protein
MWWSVRRRRHGGSQQDETLLLRLFPVDVVTCVLPGGTGATTVWSSCRDYATMFTAAAATATLMRSWGWDESPSIVVEFVSSSAGFEVDPVFIEGAWRVRCD